MPQNNRLLYSIYAPGFARLGVSPDASGQSSGIYTTGVWKRARGCQSANSNVNFTLDRVMELGQLDVYEYIEDIPSVEVTIEKVVDGFPLIQHLATMGATSPTLAGRYNANQCEVLIPFFNETNDGVSGFPLTAVWLSGLYVQSINWNIPVQGHMTESVTLVGNHRVWDTSWAFSPWDATSYWRGTESPTGYVTGVVRRENILMGSGLTSSRWPQDINGIDISGYNILVSGSYAAHIQDVTIALNLGRTELFELGSRGPFYRYAEFPVDVTTTINVHVNENGDAVNAYPDRDNLSDRRIIIRADQGIEINLGTKNKLQSVNLNGGDTGGGNVTAAYTYQNGSFYVCLASGDPAGLVSF